MQSAVCLYVNRNMDKAIQLLAFKNDTSHDVFRKHNHVLVRQFLKDKKIFKNAQMLPPMQLLIVV